jgi:cyclomaltodextrinase / maltogenic alpha-amylase / neopullulanase
MNLTDRPSWVADAIFYQIFPDRFAKSDRVAKPGNLEAWDAPPTRFGYKGGDLVGVSDHLDWLTDLGVNAIYFNPIFRSASNHRYHTHDFLEIDPLLGGDAGFEHLLRECEQHRIRVVLDGVFNHASRGFFQFNDVLENGEQSPWIDWFTIEGFPLNAYEEDTAPNYAAWWGNPALPKLNTDNPAVRQYLMGVAEHWIRRGAHGWRFDVPEEITTPGFWEEMRQRIRAVDPDAYLVGEVWNRATAWIGDGSRFDGVMNYPITEANLRFAAGGRVDVAVAEPVNLALAEPLDGPGYSAAVADHLGAYPWEAHLANLNLLGSHDTARVHSMLGGDTASVRLAAALMFTFPGAPCIYYGDEIGLRGGHDPGSRGGFPWNADETWDNELLQCFRELSALRSREPALRYGVYATVGASNGLYAFSRTLGQRQLTIAVNAGDAATTIHTQPTSQSELLWGAGSLGSEGVIDVPGRSVAVWGGAA